MAAIRQTAEWATANSLLHQNEPNPHSITGFPCFESIIAYFNVAMTAKHGDTRHSLRDLELTFPEH